MSDFSKYNNPIPFEDFEKAFMILKKNQCHEVLFAVTEHEKFHHCWMGCQLENSVPSFWFGLTQDGSYAYDFETFDEFVVAPVFDGKSLKELWNKVEIKSFDALNPQVIFNA